MIYGFGRIYEELKSIEENEFNFKEEVVCVWLCVCGVWYECVCDL